MIEVYRKGFRLDIDPATTVTFKKAQNLNGIQNRYGYSNTISVDKTGNNLKLLELLKLPTNKAATLQNGYEVDIVLNGSIQLRNQIMKITKESLEKVDLYLLYSDNALVTILKNTFINSLVSGFKYKKTIADFNLLKNGTVYRTGLVETQPKSGLFVIEEMPVFINLREIIRLMFTTNHYSVYGDFFEAANPVKDYWVAPNQGTYQIYSGSGDGFAPTFDPVLDAYTFLNQTMQYFNSYATVDDTYKTVVINSWKNLGLYKSNYLDLSKYFDNYQDYTFQSKLAKRNDMTYADSGTTYNSFFPNNLSSETRAVYMAAAFGAGSLNTFDDSTLDDDGLIEIRSNGFVGETSAVRIFKIAATNTSKSLYVAGDDTLSTIVSAKKAIPVSMGDVYTDFHKDYTDFILTPIVANLKFRYDDIVAADFSLTKVFFVEQLAAYWIPLEINFTTQKDQILIKAMLVKKRKVVAPVLNNFNSVFLDFKEKAVFPLEYLNSMYLMPPNEYPWDVVIFRAYNQNYNRLYINDVLVPAASLPQSFDLSAIATMKLEANKDTDTIADKNTDSLYLQAVDTNGGVSNQAYITIKHTGIASLQSNFAQVPGTLNYNRAGFQNGTVYITSVAYYIGPKPNLNTTITSVAPHIDPAVSDTFNLVVTSEAYTNVKVEVPSFTLLLETDNNGGGDARAIAQLIVEVAGVQNILYEATVRGNASSTITVPARTLNTAAILTGGKIRAYLKIKFDNLASFGSMDTHIGVTNMKVNISTVKTT